MNVFLMRACFFLASIAFHISEAVFSDWNYWPSTGRGPESWGYFSGAQQCRVGRRQSPIDIDPAKLLFDPSLRTPLTITQEDLQVPLSIVNTGIDVTIRSNTPPVNNQETQIKITGGPLIYEYVFHEAHFHWGSSDWKGSEHSLGGKSFPAELQLLGYNTVFNNFSSALRQPLGIVGVALLFQIGNDSEINSNVRYLMDKITTIQYKDSSTDLQSFSIAALLPNTSFYMTYEGSLTFPPCSESVVWVVSNRPIVVSPSHIKLLRNLKSTRELAGVQVPLIDNIRTVQQANPLYEGLTNPVVRTNINFTKDEHVPDETLHWLQSKCLTAT